MMTAMARYAVTGRKVKIDGVAYSEGETVDINKRRRDWRWLLEAGYLVEVAGEAD